MTRRPATVADLVIGALVYRGKGSVAYRVVFVYADDARGKFHAVKAASEVRSAYGHSYLYVKDFTVEEG